MRAGGMDRGRDSARLRTMTPSDADAEPSRAPGAKDRFTATACRLVRGCRVGALGTLHGNAPAVSMVPYAVADQISALLVLTSLLAEHTRDMLAEPDVALMIMQPEGGDAIAHSLARVSIRGRASAIAHDSSLYPGARAVYAARFPEMAMLFELGDFRLFAIEPLSVRVVAGFAQAASLGPEALWRSLRG